MRAGSKVGGPISAGSKVGDLICAGSKVGGPVPVEARFTEISGFGGAALLLLPRLAPHPKKIADTYPPNPGG